MAGPQVSKAQPEKAEKDQVNAISEKPGFTGGTAIYQSPSAEERTLAELLLLRCGDSKLIGSQVIEQAKLCGQAVKAAFKELHAVDAEE